MPIEPGRPRPFPSARTPSTRRAATVALLALLATLLSIGPVAAAGEPLPSAAASDPAPTPTLPPSPDPTSTPSPDRTLPPSPAPSPAPTLEPPLPPAPAEVSAPAPSADPAAAPLPPFSVNLYRSRAFVRQYTRSWCVAAATMTMANTLRVIRDATSWVDRTYVRQRRIISYAKSQDTLRSSDGSDPRGWAAALRRYGGGATYRERAFTSYDAAVRYAAERIRATGKPVGILAWHGGHAWIMHGYTADADPAVTDAFTVTSVWVTGPLAGTDPRNGELDAATFARKWGRYLQRDGYRGWYKKWLLVAP